MYLNPRGIVAAGRVEHHGLQLGTATAERVLEAYFQATRVSDIPRSVEELEAGDVSRVLSALEHQSPAQTSMPMARALVIPEEAHPAAIEDIIYLDEETAVAAMANIYDSLPPYVDAFAARIMTAGRYRAEFDTPIYLRLGLQVKEVMEVWPSPRIAVLWQRSDKTIEGAELSLATAADMSCQVRRGDSSTTNLDLIFSHTRWLELRSPST